MEQLVRRNQTPAKKTDFCSLTAYALQAWDCPHSSEAFVGYLHYVYLHMPKSGHTKIHSHTHTKSYLIKERQLAVSHDIQKKNGPSATAATPRASDGFFQRKY